MKDKEEQTIDELIDVEGMKARAGLLRVISTIKDNGQEIEEFIRHKSHLRRVRYEALIQEGFTEIQAFHLMQNTTDFIV